MPPKLRDLSITATERTAITAILQTERMLGEQMGQLQAQKAEIASDIERRLRLPAGALGEHATHLVNLDEGRVEPIEPEKE